MTVTRLVLSTIIKYKVFHVLWRRERKLLAQGSHFVGESHNWCGFSAVYLLVHYRWCPYRMEFKRIWMFYWMLESCFNTLNEATFVAFLNNDLEWLRYCIKYRREFCRKNVRKCGWFKKRGFKIIVLTKTKLRWFFRWYPYSIDENCSKWCWLFRFRDCCFVYESCNLCWISMIFYKWWHMVDELNDKQLV